MYNLNNEFDSFKKVMISIEESMKKAIETLTDIQYVNYKIVNKFNAVNNLIILDEELGNYNWTLPVKLSTIENLTEILSDKRNDIVNQKILDLYYKNNGEVYNYMIDNIYNNELMLSKQQLFKESV